VTVAVATTAFGVGTGSAASAAPAKGKLRSAHTAGAVRDSYIVVLKDKSAQVATIRSTAASLARVHGGEVKQTYSNALKGYAARMSEAQAKLLAAQPEVAYVEQNHTVKKATDVRQDNPPSWGLDRIDQSYRPLDNAYIYSTTASNVRVYVLDTGINKDHQEFGVRASYGQNFAPVNSKNPDLDPSYGADPVDPANANDCDGHGTHVAGTIGGTTFGVAKGVTLVAVRVLNCAGYGTTAGVLAGIDWVKNDPTRSGVPAVANMSLGSSASTAINDSVKAAIAGGVTFAVAAGNERWDACFDSPASVPEAITVGATDSSDRRAAFSNFGPCVDVFAPGVGITSAWNNSTSATATISGTSMATPHVAGAAALLLGANPTLTPAQVQTAIVNGAVTGAVNNPGVGSPNKLLQVGAATATPGKVIRLRALANGAVVTAERAGAQPLIANRLVPGDWEEFEEVPVDGVWIALRSHANGKLVTAESAGAQPLIANRDVVGVWETFELVTP
jgi:subtilisin family serine protease